MDLCLTDRVALVTGGSRGLGKAVAEAMAAEGAKVAICARDEEILIQTAEEISRAGGEVLPVVADVTSPEDRDLYWHPRWQIGSGRWRCWSTMLAVIGEERSATLQTVIGER